ncbi:putative 54S ribosomal protein L24, mitochondrial [Iris pallida]|uniref:54S ribosomal protein L24, mitochondrial n=1 Tax=Iris pallida TaxID=29817 RepID=A0AAX6H0Q4_IRIPA|nr:putative 54S ribosomal protein L24, mitochondrial [Iris pallida]
MAQRSPAIYKRIVRKVGSDLLPAEVLGSLKKPLPETTGHNKEVTSGSSKSSKIWKPSLQLKRLFNYIHDENIQPKGSIYSIRCVDKMGRTTKYQIETPYDNVETGKGGLWRGKVERMYVQLKRGGVRFLSPEEENKIKKTSTKLKKV